MSTFPSIGAIGSNVTLSGTGNLTATVGNTTIAGATALSAYKKTGKWYFEITWVTLASTGSFAGIVGPGATLFGTDTVTNVAKMAAGPFKSGNLYNNTAQSVSIGSYSNGAVLCFAVDLDNGKFWCRLNGGNWNGGAIGSQNPATNTGGYDISAWATHLCGVCPAVVFGGSTSDSATFNFGNSSFAQTAPSGFSSWDKDTVAGAVSVEGLSMGFGGTLNNAAPTVALGGTGGTNRIIQVTMDCSGNGSTAAATVSSVTASGLTFTKKYSQTLSSSNGAKNNQEVWTAPAATQLGATTITVNLTGTLDHTILSACAIVGADQTTPLDSNAALPAKTSDNSGSSTLGNVTPVSTTATDPLVFALWVRNTGDSTPTPGSSYSQVTGLDFSSGGSNWQVMELQAANPGSALSSATINNGITTANWAMMAWAYKPPSTGQTGTWASTETADTFAGAGRPGPYGTMAPTEAKDVFAGTGFQGDLVTGSLAAIEAPDVFAGIGSTLSAVWGSTEAKDLMSSVGYPALTAVWASTEAADSFHVSGHLLALDGTAHNNSTTGSITSGNVTLTTTNANDVVVLCITTKGGSVSSITDDAGLTWTKRTKFNPASTPTEDMEIWWAPAPAALSADVITVHFSTTNGYAIEAFAISGANTGTPFDAHNANSVTTDNAGSGNPTRTITTDFTGDQFIFGFLGSDDGGGDVSSVATGMTTFVNKCGGAPYAALGYAWKHTNQTNLSLSFTQNGGPFNDRFLMADAIVARVDIIGTMFTSDVKDSFSGAGYPQVIGSWGSTEAKDVWSGTGTVPPFGTLGATEAKDTFGFTGEVGRPLSIDASAAAVGHNVATKNISITTTVTDDIIVLGILNGGFFNSSEVGSITDTAGLTWRPRQRRKQFGTNPIMEIWWAKKHTPGATTITVNFLATTGFICIDAIAVSGARADAPWDTHSGAGIYNDNFGTGNPTGTIFSNSSRCLGLAFYSSNDVDNDGTVTAGWTNLDQLAAGETSGQTGRLDSAYQLFTTQQLGATTVTFGNVGGGSNNRCIMQDVIVANNEPLSGVSTADVVRWFFDGHGNQNIVAMSGSANSLSQSVTTWNPDTTLLVAAMVQSGLGTRVLNVSDDGNHSGWTRRSIVTDTVGNNSLELWWVQLPEAFAGNVTVTLDSNVRPGDILGFIVVAINGPDLFARGEIFDGHSSLPAHNHADAVSDPSVGPFSTLNANVLEIVIAANQSQDQRGFEAPGWLQFIGNFFGSESGILVSHSPFYNIAIQAKFSGPVVINDSTSLAISPTPTTWMILADAMPVGPASPPQGTWASTDVKDTFGNSGAFNAIGIDSHGWVGFPPNHAAMAAVETKDRTTNSGAFASIWDSNGWIGYIPAHMTMACVEAKDISSLHAWILGPTTILAQMGATDHADYMQLAALHSQYTTADSIGDRTSRITVTTNASLGGGTPDNLVDGLKANGATSALFVNNAQSAPMFFKFDFGVPRVVQEAKWYQNGTSPQPGQWVWRGSNDNVTFTTISAPFTLDAGNGGGAIGDLSANGTAYRYYQILQTTNAGGNDTPWLWEIEFKVEGIVGTMGAVESKDRLAGNGLVIPTALPIPARKRRLLIVN